MADYVEDLDVWPLMLELLACVCEELKRRKLPAPCRCNVMPGDAPVVDFGAETSCRDGNGQAWVRLVGGGPSGAEFPAYGPSAAVNCDTRMAWELEVGISRNEDGGSVINNKPVPPSETSQFEAVRLYVADAAAMKAAILCCFRTDHSEEDDLEVALGVYAPAVSGGGAGGGTWRVVVRRS